MSVFCANIDAMGVQFSHSLMLRVMEVLITEYWESQILCYF